MLIDSKCIGARSKRNIAGCMLAWEVLSVGRVKNNLNIENTGKFIFLEQSNSVPREVNTALGRVLQEKGKLNTMKFFLNTENEKGKVKQEN